MPEPAAAPVPSADVGDLTGHWIWHEAPARAAMPVVRFRRIVPPSAPSDAGPARLQIRITSASVHELSVNGVVVSRGPQRGTPSCHWYDELDLTIPRSSADAPLVVEALVAHFSDPRIRPGSRCDAGRPGLLIAGTLTVGGTTVDISTGPLWQARTEEALTLVPEEVTSAVGHREVVRPGTPPGPWVSAVITDDAVEPSIGGHTKPYLLVPSPLRTGVARPGSFAAAQRPGRAATWDPDRTRILLESGATLEPGSRHVIHLDAGALVVAHLRLAWQGGARSRLAAVTAEAFVRSDGTKGVRSDGRGASLPGNAEVIHVGGADGTHRTLLPRTFRFVELQVEVGDHPLTLLPPGYDEAPSGLRVTATFECSEPELNRMWEVSLRTLRNCWQDTIVDCPYYEQLQYAMDARLMSLYAQPLTDDLSLVRKAIHDLHASLQPEGLTMSRAPAVLGQQIPTFSLQWIHLLAEHVARTGETETAERYLPTVAAVLGWYRRRITADGLVGPAPRHTWAFVDWTPQWRESRGVPAGGRRVPLTTESLQYALALRAAAALLDRCGDPHQAARRRSEADEVVAAVDRHAWDEAAGRYADAPGEAEHSEHAQVLAVLASAGNPARRHRLAVGLQTSDGNEPPLSYVWQYFRFQALEQEGLRPPDALRWGPWRDQLALDLTTWLEDPVSQRSDCHGWGALPAHELTRTVLGVRESDTGLLVAPQVDDCRWAAGTVATRGGAVQVRWALTDTDELELSLAGLRGRPTVVRPPYGTPVTLEATDTWQGRFVHPSAADAAP